MINKKPIILLCGPSRNSVSGVATHLNQLFDSDLSSKYKLIQFQVGSEGRNDNKIQQIARLLTSPLYFILAIIQEKPDIIHLNSSLVLKSYWRDLIYLFAAKLMRCNVVYQVHGGELPSDFLGSSLLANFFLRWSLNLPDALSLLAKIEREAYNEFKINKPIKVIPNAINLDEYHNATAKQYKSENIIIGYIGRLAFNKGIKETIQALAILRNNGTKNLKLKIAGSGPYEDELRKLVVSESVESLVEFVGPIFAEDKLQFLNEIDLFVFPTFHCEGLPYTVLESLASGTPMITTRVGGISDVIQNNIHGVFVEPHNPSEVADKIEELINNKDKLKQMSVAAIYRAKEHYGIARLASQFDLLYQELLS